MQAISKEGHKHFCNLIQEIRTTNSLQDYGLTEMESELIAIYQNYQQHINELRELIPKYDAKKKMIRNRIKQLVREDTIKQAYKMQK